MGQDGLIVVVVDSPHPDQLSQPIHVGLPSGQIPPGTGAQPSTLRPIPPTFPSMSPQFLSRPVAAAILAAQQAQAAQIGTASTVPLPTVQIEPPTIQMRPPLSLPAQEESLLSILELQGIRHHGDDGIGIIGARNGQLELGSIGRPLSNVALVLHRDGLRAMSTNTLRSVGSVEPLMLAGQVPSGQVPPLPLAAIESIVRREFVAQAIYLIRTDGVNGAVCRRLDVPFPGPVRVNMEEVGVQLEQLQRRGSTLILTSTSTSTTQPVSRGLNMGGGGYPYTVIVVTLGGVLLTELPRVKSDPAGAAVRSALAVGMSGVTVLVAGSMRGVPMPTPVALSLSGAQLIAGTVNGMTAGEPLFRAATDTAIGITATTVGVKTCLAGLALCGPFAGVCCIGGGAISSFAVYTGMRKLSRL